MNKEKIFKRLFFLVIFLFVFIFYYISINANFFIFLVMSFIFLYLVIMIIYVYFYFPNVAKERPFPKKAPSVAVITYAYNNFLPVKRTVLSLLNLKYPIKFKVYVITDGTCSFLNKIKGVKQIIIDKKYFKKSKNIKAIIMNEGLKSIKEENIFCVDGDTLVNSDVLMKLTGFLEEEKVVAVNGILVPENKKSFFEKVQVIEYSLNWGIYLRILSAMNSINIPIGAMFLMKKKVFDSLGGYCIDNFVEDKELGYRIIKAGYHIRCCETAHGFTETPKTFFSWFRQRKRWARGELATIYQHRDVLFNKKYNVFGLFILPFTFFVQTIGVAFIFSFVFIYLKRQIIYLYFFIIESINQGILILPKFESIVLPSTIYIFFLSIIVFIVYALSAFKITKFNLNYKYIFPLVFFLLIYTYLLVSVYLISMVLEFIGYENKW
jgi:peptidoglycan-N-acetylglucosamine deacetylase